MVGFSLWKRAFMRAFCQPLAEELRFVRKLPETLADDEQVLVWGSAIDARTPSGWKMVLSAPRAGLKPVPPFVALHRPGGDLLRQPPSKRAGAVAKSA
jgi:hypothetical protein